MTNINQILSSIGIDLQRIVVDQLAWPLNRQLATKLSMVPNFKVGDFLKSITDEELNVLVEDITEMPLSDHTAAELYLMVILLSVAEGLEVTDEVLDVRFESVVTLISFESLKRKGVVNIDYDLMSLDFGDTMDFVKATNIGLEVVKEVLDDEGKES